MGSGDIWKICIHVISQPLNFLWASSVCRGCEEGKGWGKTAWFPLSVGLCPHVSQCESWDGSQTPTLQGYKMSYNLSKSSQRLLSSMKSHHKPIIPWSQKNKTASNKTQPCPWALSEGTHGHLYALSLCSNFSLSVFPPTFLFWWNLFCLKWLHMQPYLSLVKSIPSYRDLDWGSD